MPDVVDSATRSRMMSGIRGKNTKPELLIRKALHSLGFRYRLHAKGLPGRPDLVFPKFRAAVFINGCFWHGHDCDLFRMPATREQFWREKIGANRARDVRSHAALRAANWRTLDIWECAIRPANGERLEAVVSQTAEWLRDGDASSEIRRPASLVKT